MFPGLSSYSFLNTDFEHLIKPLQKQTKKGRFDCVRLNQQQEQIYPVMPRYAIKKAKQTKANPFLSKSFVIVMWTFNVNPPQLFSQYL